MQRRDHDWEAVRSYYQSGVTAYACREHFGISKRAWYAAIDRGAITPRRDGLARPHGTTRLAVEKLLEDGLTLTQIAGRLNISKPTVCFHMRRLGIPVSSGADRRYDWNEIRAYYDAGHSIADCRRCFGFSRDAWAAAVARGDVAPRPRLELLEAVLVNGRRRNRSHVKLRLLMAGLKDSRCEICGLADWRSRPISLELHHVNGDGLDNRVENLQLLCPNCHSQTDTWGGRNKLARMTT
ncbi:MAG TPA: HNH endonuclease [Solirubrobacteraceae bacterium]